MAKSSTRQANSKYRSTSSWKKHFYTIVGLVLLIAVPLFVLMVQDSHDDRSDAAAPQIVGGQPVPDGKYPFMAVLLSEKRGNSPYQQQWCGGTLITNQDVLTAAHCVKGIKPEINPTDWSIAVGCTLLSSTQCQRVPIAKITVDPHYNGNVHDVAVVRLATPVDFPTIALPTAADMVFEEPNTQLIVAGWGSITQHKFRKGNKPNSYPVQMQEVTVPVVSNKRCVKEYDRKHGIHVHPNLQICAGAEMKADCFGDSGGPLFAKRPDDTYVQIGIVNEAIGCGDGRFASIFARVSAPDILSFINSATQ